MYGANKLNSHYILCYGFTKEFFDEYKQLRYLNLEIPPTLIRHFHVFLKPWIIHHRVKSRSVLAMKKKHNMLTAKKVQATLGQYLPVTARNLAREAHRKAIVVHIRLIHFALEKLKNYRVILLLTSFRDEKYLAGKQLPENFIVFKISDELKQVKLEPETYKDIKSIIKRKTKFHSKHPIFGMENFHTWLYNKTIHSAKMIKILETLIRKEPIGLILDQTELVNPGNTLSLLAKKYNLPFILAPQVLITDFSFLPSRAAYYCAWGPNMYNWIKDRGIPEKKIELTGNLRFQYELNLSFPTRKTQFFKKNLPELAGKPEHIVSYLTQPYEETVGADVMKWISTTASQYPDIHFLIKTHPADPFHNHTNMQARNIHLLPKDAELYDVLQHSDVMMTISSNTAIEAALLNTPLIVLQPAIPYCFDKNNNDYCGHLARASAGPVARNQQELSDYIGQFFSNPSFRNHVHDQVQHFLSLTLQTSKKPASITYELIRNLLGRTNVS